ncbi:TPA: GGDEF domain-containing protein [Candidatus Poribacteria bacterium]|nr:GGDEF domain-containing protein [Candidatus Poribacteria bacterium]
MKEQNEERDALTGFLTHTAFEKEFAQHLHESIEKGEALSLAIADLDLLRRFNDTHGQIFGNDALRKMAESFRQHIPRNAIAGRFGGEEFIVLFPKTEREEAFLAIERIRMDWDVEREFSDGQNIISAKLTLSGGVAAYPADGTTVAEILRKAEQALYRAKVSGRNRICIAQEERMIPKTAHYTATQLERLAKLAKEHEVPEALFLREALDCLLRKYTVSEKLS